MNKNNLETLDSCVFDELISPFFEDIKKYCLRITSTEWEAEDLLQDTMMKLYLLFKQNPNLQISKRFLFLIAKNTWIDQKRKKAVPIVPLSNLDIDRDHKSASYLTFDIRETLEILADYLSIKQFIIVLLMDVFLFTAKETAFFLKETESNMHTSLHRARQKIKKFVNSPEHLVQGAIHKSKHKKQQIDYHVFESFIQAFRNRNPRALFEAYLSLSERQIIIDKVPTLNYSHCFQFKDPDGNVLTICA